MKYLVTLLLFVFALTTIAQEHYFFVRVQNNNFKNRGKSIFTVPNTTLESFKPLLSQQGEQQLRKRGIQTAEHRLKNVFKLTYSSNLSTDAIKNYLSHNFFIEEVTAIPQAELLTVVSDTFATADKSQLITHDFFSAWDISEGDSNIVIGVVDTGIKTTHEDLKNKIKTNHNDPIDGKNNDGDLYFGDSVTDNYAGWDIADFDNNPIGSSGHGTWVASVAVAEHNGKGVAGSCPKCLLLPIKAAKDANQNSVSHGYDGLLYAAEHGAKVINLSWGSIIKNEDYHPILKDLIHTVAVDMDVVIIAAGGNRGEETNYQPSSQKHVLGVTALQPDTSVWTHTSYNTDMDIIAHGGWVYVADNATDSSYHIDAGSSLATPLVSGAAGLIRSKFPHYTSEQVIQKLRVTGLSIDSLVDVKYAEKIGFMLNPKRALIDTLTPALRITERNYNDLVSGNGDTITIQFKYTNYLYPAPVTATLKSTDSLSLVVDSLESIPAIAMLDTSDYYEKRIYIPPFSGDTIFTTVRTGFSGNHYNDYQYEKLMFRKDNITSIETKTVSKTNYIYPNPSTQKGTLYFNKEIENLSIHSLDGRTLYSWTEPLDEIKLPPSLATGLYIIKTNLYSTTLTIK